MAGGIQLDGAVGVDVANRAVAQRDALGRETVAVGVDRAPVEQRLVLPPAPVRVRDHGARCETPLAEIERRATDATPLSFGF
jgi:hypothetical protein